MEKDWKNTQKSIIVGIMITIGSLTIPSIVSMFQVEAVDFDVMREKCLEQGYGFSYQKDYSTGKIVKGECSSKIEHTELSKMHKNVLKFLDTGIDTFQVTNNCDIRFIDYLELWREDPVDHYGKEVNEVYLICHNEPTPEEISVIYKSIHNGIPFATIVPYGVDHNSDWKGNYLTNCTYGFEKIMTGANSYRCEWTGEDYWNKVKCIEDQCFFKEKYSTDVGNNAIKVEPNRYESYINGAQELCEKNGYKFYKLSSTSFCSSDGEKFLEIVKIENTGSEIVE